MIFRLFILLAPVFYTPSAFTQQLHCNSQYESLSDLKVETRINDLEDEIEVSEKVTLIVNATEHLSGLIEEYCSDDFEIKDIQLHDRRLRPGPSRLSKTIDISSVQPACLSEVRKAFASEGNEYISSGVYFNEYTSCGKSASFLAPSLNGLKYSHPSGF